MDRPPAFLTPRASADTLKETRWGGSRLGLLRGGPAHRERAIGESWEFSTLPGHDSRVGDRTLRQVLGAPLGFLAKLIDTAHPLSVQVHPDDGEDTAGKEEAWIILDAEPGARLWAGLVPGVCAEQFLRALPSPETPPEQAASFMGLLQTIEATAGTCVLVPAGTVHAIGGGILLAEIQQPSDLTYRFYDHGRDRPLHRSRASRVLREDARPQIVRPGRGDRVTVAGKHVSLEVITAGVREHHDGHPRLVVPVHGSVRVSKAEGGSTALRPGDLRLWIGPGRVEVDEGLAVIGTVDGPDQVEGGP